ncbi:helix-turn-helix domain-containing protein [Alkalicoccus luteus]|nr:helix-turn-helix domain-containing protein [Alkalicoccus luteus]
MYSYTNIYWEMVAVNEMGIGKKLKELRTFFGVSQQELCSGLCTQGYISKLEQGLVHPSADLTAELAERLGVDIQYLFDASADISKVNYLYTVMESIAASMDRTDYKAVLATVEAEENHPEFQKGTLRQYLLWRKGICLYHIRDDVSEAVRCLDEAAALTPATRKNPTVQDLDIMLSKAIIFSMADRQVQAENVYRRLLHAARRHPYLPKSSLLVRLYYNYSKNQFEQDKWKESLELAGRGIQLCHQTESMYMLGELYFQYGQSGRESDRFGKEETKEYYEKAKFLFQLRGNHFFADVVSEELAELLEE